MYRLQDYLGNVITVYAINKIEALKKAKEKTGFIYYLID